MSRIAHEQFTDPAVGEDLAACESEPDLISDPQSVEAVNLREIRRHYDRKTCLPASLVEEEAALSSRAMHRWAEARKASDFSMFQPELEQVLDLMKRKADCYGWAAEGEPWDALAEDYEPGCTAAEVEAVFTPLRVDYFERSSAAGLTKGAGDWQVDFGFGDAPREPGAAPDRPAPADMTRED